MIVEKLLENELIKAIYMGDIFKIASYTSKIYESDHYEENYVRINDDWVPTSFIVAMFSEIELLKALLDKSQDVYSVSKKRNETILFYAARSDDYRNLELILETRKVNHNIKNINNHKWWHVFMLYHPDVVEGLIPYNEIYDIFSNLDENDLAFYEKHKLMFSETSRLLLNTIFSSTNKKILK